MDGKDGVMLTPAIAYVLCLNFADKDGIGFASDRTVMLAILVCLSRPDSG